MRLTGASDSFIQHIILLIWSFSYVGGWLGVQAKQWEAIPSHLLNPIDIINTSIFGGQKNLLARIADATIINFQALRNLTRK